MGEVNEECNVLHLVRKVLREHVQIALRPTFVMSRSEDVDGMNRSWEKHAMTLCISGSV